MCFRITSSIVPSFRFCVLIADFYSYFGPFSDAKRIINLLGFGRAFMRLAWVASSGDHVFSRWVTELEIGYYRPTKTSHRALPAIDPSSESVPLYGT